MFLVCYQAQHDPASKPAMLLLVHSIVYNASSKTHSTISDFEIVTFAAVQGKNYGRLSTVSCELTEGYFGRGALRTVAKSCFECLLPIIEFRRSKLSSWKMEAD